jgi:hypothetical protein
MLGAFDPQAHGPSWFDPDVTSEGWYDRDLIVAADAGGGSALTQDIDDTLALADAIRFDRQIVLTDTLALADDRSFQREEVIADTL